MFSNLVVDWFIYSLLIFLYLKYSEAQKQVEDMEKERRKLDKQLDVVQEKTKRAYLSQEILEAKMKVGVFKTKLFF